MAHLLGAILASGLAIGAVYALIGVTYNVMFSASRVMSFTAGQLFLGVVAWLFLERRQRFEQAARQPLEDDERSVRS